MKDLENHYLMHDDGNDIIPPATPKGCFWQFVICVLFFLLIALLGSCKSQRVITYETVKHDTCYVDRVQRDSVELHDSVYNFVYVKGDTVVKYKYIQKIEYRDRVKTDSIYICKTDTICKTETVEVEKKLSWWQKTMQLLGYLVLGLGITSAVLFFIKWKFNK